MAGVESEELALLRQQKLILLQEHYSTFTPFLEDFMAELGFGVTPLQRLIGQFLEFGPQYRMIQAQRSQAKTTITAAYAVWRLIHDPNLVVLILSAGGKQANEISTLIVRAIGTIPVLECMRPDPAAGDRVSVEAFDLHHSLKRLNKSPSVACTGITGNLQGKRAGLLIADDVESQKNSMTAVMREQLLLLTKDFTSICTTGEIVYLGTPQTSESIYNSLPGRGFTVRIWPGRYPTKEQLPLYGDQLCPTLMNRLKAYPELMTGGGVDGTQGRPTDPKLLDEVALQKKELDQGTAYFQLQHMLQTKLLDAERKPLHTTKLVVATLPERHGSFPMEVHRSMQATQLREFSVLNHRFQMAPPMLVSHEMATLQGVCLYIDPAGGGKNGDETGFAATGFLNGNIFLLRWGGVAGGYSDSSMQALAQLAVEIDPTVIKIEKNFGYGAFTHVFLPFLWAAYEKAGMTKPGVEDDMVHGQKELRIIETLEPVMGRGALIVDESLVRADEDQTKIHPLQLRPTYSGFFQMLNITRDKDSLIHDDRLDALEGAVRHWQQLLQLDQTKAIAAQKKREFEAWQKDPLNKRRYDPPSKRGGSIFNRRKR